MPRRLAAAGIGLLATAATVAMGLLACPSPVARPPDPPPLVGSPSASVEPLGEVTLQSALEAAFDGDFMLCYKRGRTALSIAPDDLETMELTMRCAHAQRVLPEAVAWVRSAYAPRVTAPVVRYGLALAALLRGELGEARKAFEKLAPEAPAAAYHAALAAQLDDDVQAADRFITVYVKAFPTDPAGRVLQSEIVCALDLVRCGALMDTIGSSDDDETAVARRLGAALSAPVSPSRTRLTMLAKDADTLGSVAFADAFSVAAVAREGNDPATILVRSPRSGRPEPGPGVDLVKLAHPIARLPFATRVHQLAVLNDPAVSTALTRMIALFSTELSTWRQARRFERTAVLARKELEKSAPVRWRTFAATFFARPDEICDLASTLPWTDRGPIATSTRAKCEITLDSGRGRKIADARLAVLPYGALDVETAIEGLVAAKDAVALEALARQIAKIAPASSLVAMALWAAADAGAKKAPALYAEAIAQVSADPVWSRRLLRKYVDAHDVPRAKMTLAATIPESPLDSFLCGVQGEILLHDGKPGDALPWLTKSCVSARARKEQDVLASTLSSLASAVGKAKETKDKPARDAALKCAKGE